jgi:nucleoid-associated protein YgaU
MLGGLVLALLLSVCGNAVAAEKKMTRDEYKAKVAEYTSRETAASADIAALNGDIAKLNAELAALDTDIATLRGNILSLIGATDAEVMAFGRQLDAIIAQLEGLMALPPERLIQRRGEFKAVQRQVTELKASKISALPEMKTRLDRIGGMIDQLRARIAQPVTIDYTVQRGDNLWNIAKKDEIYADPYMWPRIYRANRDGIRDPDLIYPQQKLAVPFGVTENQYLVTRGDFLSRIAADVYNDPTKWHRIYEANKQQIVAPEMIFPAQVLDIPAN